jgi:SAM-dependent methyltransferase
MAAHARTTWGLGEYELIAEHLEPAASAVVELAGVNRGDRVLDLACGTGNAALIAARHGASVVGVDVEPRLLELAAARARDAGMGIEWVCDDLLSARGAFSVVLSVFGVMYAADQAAAAAAVARCCAPGARVALAAWAPGSFMPAMGAALAPYLPPPPPGAASPARWGDPEAAAALMRPHGLAVRRTTAASLPLSFAGRPQAVDFLIRTAGHVRGEQARLQREGRWGGLVEDLERLVAAWDEGHGARVELRCDHLLVLAEREG